MLGETGNVGKGKALFSLVDSVVNLEFKPGLELRVKESLRQSIKATTTKKFMCTIFLLLRFH